MTLLPLEDRNVRGVEGPSYELDKVCSHPACGETYGLEKHHLFRRSFLIGAYDWVQIPDGTVIGNWAYLCQEHHRQVTDNEVRITLCGADLAYFWGHPDGGTMLDPQPPLGAALGVSAVEDSAESLKKGEVGTCPACGQRVTSRRKKHACEPDKPLAPGRCRSIPIPLWARTNGEDGHKLLGELLDLCVEPLERMGQELPPKGRDYKILSLVLADWLDKNR